MPPLRPRRGERLVTRKEQEVDGRLHDRLVEAPRAGDVEAPPLSGVAGRRSRRERGGRIEYGLAELPQDVEFPFGSDPPCVDLPPMLLLAVGEPLGEEREQAGHDAPNQSERPGLLPAVLSGSVPRLAMPLGGNVGCPAASKATPTRGASVAGSLFVGIRAPVGAPSVVAVSAVIATRGARAGAAPGGYQLLTCL